MNNGNGAYFVQRNVKSENQWQLIFPSKTGILATLDDVIRTNGGVVGKNPRSTIDDFDKVPPNSTYFGYSGEVMNSPPLTGTGIRLCGPFNGYDLMIHSMYWGGGLYYRTRNGDNDKWNPWYTIWSTFNAKPDANGFLRASSSVVDIHPVGSPIPWPQPNPPSGYLTCNGQAFNKSLYPQLAAAYPSGRLPDLRGEFIRGWDDGRGVDSGRGILSYQEGQAPVSAIAGYWDNNWHNGKHRDTGFSAATGTNNGSFHTIIQEYENQRETRPRNIAFNYIVRAA
ncbi:hypothetical protein C5470_13200 [Photorhabdus stackebrandtii]|uniref:Phage tail collar domain-containing protein n=2 Tax=Photorhabdus stackebrandtii TaxID=1123042 RepID=A0A7X5TMQ7_9GAMM|nr:hypothetical protein [Photorhabdus stackebrandtii]